MKSEISEGFSENKAKALTKRYGGIMEFVAIDFETAVGHDSPCAVGIVTVRDGVVVDEYCQLIQPPGNTYNWMKTSLGRINAHRRFRFF